MIPPHFCVSVNELMIFPIVPAPDLKTLHASTHAPTHSSIYPPILTPPDYLPVILLFTRLIHPLLTHPSHPTHLPLVHPSILTNNLGEYCEDQVLALDLFLTVLSSF